MFCLLNMFVVCSKQIILDIWVLCNEVVYIISCVIFVFQLLRITSPCLLQEFKVGDMFNKFYGDLAQKSKIPDTGETYINVPFSYLYLCEILEWNCIALCWVEDDLCGLSDWAVISLTARKRKAENSINKLSNAWSGRTSTSSTVCICGHHNTKGTLWPRVESNKEQQGLRGMRYEDRLKELNLFSL